MKHGPKLMETWESSIQADRRKQKTSEKKFNVTWELSVFKCSYDIQGVSGTYDIDYQC